jgi:hypothetical protein
VLDHLLVDVLTALRTSFDEALLQRQAVEERFQVDVFLGDVSFETSYSLPGEEQPPRVRADLSVDWPTWSQTAYRSWSIGETPQELPEMLVEVALRIQRLAEPPALDTVTAVLPSASPTLDGDPLVRTAVTTESVLEDLADADGTEAVPDRPRWAVEATYEGAIRFDEVNLERPDTIRPAVDALTRWVASTLVQLADLPLRFLPADPAGER